MNINIGRTILGGILGTVAMTAIGLWVAPMMGMPIFSGSAAMAMGSLVGHLVYGGVVGEVYGEAAEARAVPAMS
jgi:hypothetical protein